MTICSDCSVSWGCRRSIDRGLLVLRQILCAGLIIAALTGCGPAPKKRAVATPEPEAIPATETAEVSPTPGAASPANSKPRPQPLATKAAVNQKPTPARSVGVSKAPPPAELWKSASGDQVVATAGKLVALGPRTNGSPALTQAQEILTAALTAAAWEVEPQTFAAASPRGEVRGTNLVARFSSDGARPVPRTPRNVVLGAHYDTRSFSTMKFLGAHEGASGPALLVEVARVLALDPALAAKVEIVFFDASEPRGQFTPDEGLFGSKEYARQAKSRRTLVVAGVGDSATSLIIPPETDKPLLADLRAAAPVLHTPLTFRFAPFRIWGDHLSFGANALLLANAEAVFRYTADDTMERLDPITLGHTAELVIWLAKHWAASEQ